MEKPMIMGDMAEPKYMQKGYAYIGEDGHWHITEDAPDWAKKEFEEFNAMVNPDPDEDGLVIHG